MASTNGNKIAHLVTKTYRPLDLGGHDSSRAGDVLDVWVNAPGIIELIANREAFDYKTLRKTVQVLFEFEPEEAASLDDDFMLWLFEQGTAIYTDYHTALKKK